MKRQGKKPIVFFSAAFEKVIY